MHEWMPILLVIFVIAMALGPIMLMQPTSQQRRLAKLRTQASQRGIQVGTSVWPDKHNKPVNLVRYTLPWQRSQKKVQNFLLMRKDYAHELHIAQNWQANPTSGAVSPAVKSLLETENIPVAIAAIGQNPSGVYIDWVEGGEQSLESASAFLTRFEQAAAGYRA